MIGLATKAGRIASGEFSYGESSEKQAEHIW